MSDMATATLARNVAQLRRRIAGARFGLGGALIAVLGLYAALVPSMNLLPGVGLYNGKRLLQVALLLGMGLWLVFSKQARTLWLSTFRALPAATRWGVAAVFCLGGGSAARAAVPRYAFIEFFHFALLFVLVVAVAGACRRRPRAASKGIVATAVLSVFLYAVTFAVGYAGHLGGAFLLWPDAALGFANVRHFNQYQTWTLPLVVAAPLFVSIKDSKTLRGALYGLAALWWALLFASGGRGTLVATIFSIAGAGVLFGRAAWPWLRSQLATFFSGGLLFWAVFKVISASQSTLASRALADDNGRFQAWGDALEMAVQSLPLGAGPMHYAHFPARSIWAHPHNALLQWAAEWGLPAALIVLALAAWGLWAWGAQSRQTTRQSASSNEKLIRVAATAALLAGTAHSLVSGIIVAPLSQLLIVVVVGWVWGIYRNSKTVIDEFPRQRSSLVRDRFLQIGLAVTLGALTWGVSSDVPELPTRREAYFKASGSLKMWPRYWQQGYFGAELTGRETEQSNHAQLKR